MISTSRLKWAGVPILVLLLVAAMTAAVFAADALTNGDFETGDLSGWSAYNTTNGTTSGTVIASFDVNGNGSATDAVKMSVGQVVADDGGCGSDAACRNASPGIFAGGGISQSFNVGTGGGTVDVSADVAVTVASQNFTGGKFELIVDGSVVDSTLIGEVTGAAIARATLSGQVALAEGVHTIAVQATRPWGTFGMDSASPIQYIDNVVADVTLDQPPPPPPDEETTMSERLEVMGVRGNGIATAPGLNKATNAPAREGVVGHGKRN